MKVHEYQAKEILRRYKVPTLEGGAAKTPAEAGVVAQTLGGPIWVVKSQVHAGGRGMGRFKEEVDAAAIELAAKGEKAPGKGGVRLARSIEEVREAAQAMLGRTLVTKQTGIEGRKVHTLFIEAGCDIARELYLAMMLDRAKNRILVMASAEGGMAIEDVAHSNPDAIKKIWVDPVTGLGGWQARKLAFALGMQGKEVGATVQFLQALYKCYVEMDASMIEINPLVVTKQGGVIALDAKMTFDDNALFRHPDVAGMRDLAEEDPAEIEASEYNLSFVKLDGNIGCLVNGAGLAMSTMDIIQFYGGSPANFLDVGGGANEKQVAAAFRIITRDPNVNAILVNIFGGIMKCDTIAKGVIAAVKEVGLKVPLVVRLEGTNVELGRKILDESGMNIISAQHLEDAAEKVVAAAKGA
jgi:succinyl-CoA synthetase beta subunit